MEHTYTFAQKITEILIKHRVIDRAEGDQLENAFKETDHDQYDDFLLQEGLIPESDLLRALSVYYQVPSTDVTGVFFEHALVTQFPKDFLLRNEMIPLEVDEESILLMVASDPGDPELVARIGDYVSYDVQFRVGLGRDIIDAIEEFYDKSLAVSQDLDAYQEQEIQDESRIDTFAADEAINTDVKELLESDVQDNELQEDLDDYQNSTRRRR